MGHLFIGSAVIFIEKGPVMGPLLPKGETKYYLVTAWNSDSYCLYKVLHVFVTVELDFLVFRLEVTNSFPLSTLVIIVRSTSLTS